MTPCKGETSEVCTRWGVSKLFIVRGVVLNLKMIESVDLPFYGRELVEDFRGEDGTKSLRIFSKPSAINGFGVPLPTTV